MNSRKNYRGLRLSVALMSRRSLMRRKPFGAGGSENVIANFTAGNKQSAYDNVAISRVSNYGGTSVPRRILSSSIKPARSTTTAQQRS